MVLQVGSIQESCSMMNVVTVPCSHRVGVYMCGWGPNATRGSPTPELFVSDPQ